MNLHRRRLPEGQVGGNTKTWSGYRIPFFCLLPPLKQGAVPPGTTKLSLHPSVLKERQIEFFNNFIRLLEFGSIANYSLIRSGLLANSHISR